LWWLDPVYKLAHSFVKHTYLSPEPAEEIIHQDAYVCRHNALIMD